LLLEVVGVREGGVGLLRQECAQVRHVAVGLPQPAGEGGGRRCHASSLSSRVGSGGPERPQKPLSRSSSSASRSTVPTERVPLEGGRWARAGKRERVSRGHPGAGEKACS